VRDPVFDPSLTMQAAHVARPRLTTRPTSRYPWQPDDAEPPLPVRGTPGGWADSWELADRRDEARWRAEAEAEERRLLSTVVALGAAWQQEVAAERRRTERERHPRRP
jgi:hypothetical protein